MLWVDPFRTIHERYGLMRTNRYITLRQVLAAAIVAFGFQGASTAAEAKPSMFDKGNGVVWGEASNDLRGGILLHPNGDFITVYVQKLGKTNVSVPRLDLSATNSTIPKPVMGAGYFDRTSPVYLAASNAFCGPIELLNATGESLTFRSHQLTAEEPYPKYLRWSILFREAMAQPTISQTVPADKVYFSGEGWVELAKFSLQETFGLKEAGEYRLTVWPKLYKRSERADEDRDVYVRIDMPPVTANINWRPARVVKP